MNKKVLPRYKNWQIRRAEARSLVTQNQIKFQKLSSNSPFADIILALYEEFKLSHHNSLWALVKKSLDGIVLDFRIAFGQFSTKVRKLLEKQRRTNEKIKALNVPDKIIIDSIHPDKIAT